MIQNFKIAFKLLWKNKNKNVIFILVCSGFVLIYLFINYQLESKSEINQLLSNIIQFSGIFSAILIIFIISKVIQIRHEKLERKKEIVKFANKITDFRRIARVLKNSWRFWDIEMRRKIDNEYEDLNFFDIKLWDYETEESRPQLRDLREAFFKEQKIPGAYLYLEIKILVLDDYHSWQLELYNRYDYDFIYEIEILEKWMGSHCGNGLWYCFVNEWSNYKGAFNFIDFRKDEEDEIIALCKKINPEKYQNSKFGNDLLGTVGSEIDAHVLPRLYDLTILNAEPLPNTLRFTLLVLFITMVCGILIPLVLTSITLDTFLLLIFSNIAVIILSLSLLYFILKFKNILDSEIKV